MPASLQEKARETGRTGGRDRLRETQRTWRGRRAPEASSQAHSSYLGEGRRGLEMSVGPALALPPSLSHASSCLGVSGVVGKAAPPEMPGWLGLRTSWRAAGKSRAVAIHSGLLLLHQNTHKAATGSPDRQEREGVETTGWGKEGDPEIWGGREGLKVRRERRGRERGERKEKAGRQTEEGGEDGLGSSWKSALGCEQTSLWACAHTWTHTHMLL